MSLREQLARRLAQINCRGAVTGPEDVPGALTAAGPGGLPAAGRVWTGRAGSCWVLQTHVPDLPEWDPSLAERLRPALGGMPCEAARGWPEAWSKPMVTALDIETCGFTSVPLFLVGLLQADGETLVLRQGLARDYGEEAALLEWTADRLAETGGIVTFNGRAFDLPYVRDRQRYHRQVPLGQLPHVDLLPVARRLWRADLPDCRLQTLEWHLTGKVRRGDISGREIPEVYHTFVDSGDPRHIAAVLHHNRRDLLILMELFATAWYHLAESSGGEPV